MGTEPDFGVWILSTLGILTTQKIVLKVQRSYQTGLIISVRVRIPRTIFGVCVGKWWAHTTWKLIIQGFDGLSPSFWSLIWSHNLPILLAIKTYFFFHKQDIYKRQKTEIWFLYKHKLLKNCRIKLCDICRMIVLIPNSI